MRVRKYSDELVAFIRNQYENSYGLTNEQVCAKVKERFDFDMTVQQMTDLKAHHHIRRKAMPIEEIKAFVTEYIKTHSRAETEEATIKKFGLHDNFSIHAFMTRHRIESGRDGRFEKGHESYNKGKKMPPQVYEKIKHSFFIKGHEPHNKCSVGTIVITPDGYLKIKVADPRKWELLHIYIWTLKNGPIPKGYAVNFIDNNRQNCVLDNLMLVQRKTHYKLNFGGYRFKDKDLQKAAILAMELQTKARKKK